MFTETITWHNYEQTQPGVSELEHSLLVQTNLGWVYLCRYDGDFIQEGSDENEISKEDILFWALAPKGMTKD